MEPLPPAPPTPAAPGGGLLHGLTAGTLRVDPVAQGPSKGRVRRWMYAAAGDAEQAVGAAVVDLGFLATAFVWASVAGHVVTWERIRPLGRGCWVGPTPRGGAGARGRDTVLISGDGGLTVDVAVGPERLRAQIEAGPVTPALLVTDTAGGGWNVTQKAAGYAATGELSLGKLRRRIDGGGWRDWTSGRQDRDTVWRWAAGAGRAVAGDARVGLNVSTGINSARDGEDVVWWDGEPYALEVTTLEPVGEDLAGPWRVAGPGWELHLDPVGARAADEDYRLLRSRYVQPVGRFRGTLPGPDGVVVEVELTGVTEDHEARW